jgi:hypothetical protein
MNQKECLVVCLDGKYGGNSNESKGLVESGTQPMAGAGISPTAPKTGEVVWSDGRDSAKPVRKLSLATESHVDSQVLSPQVGPLANSNSVVWRQCVG